MNVSRNSKLEYVILWFTDCGIVVIHNIVYVYNTICLRDQALGLHFWTYAYYSLLKLTKLKLLIEWDAATRCLASTMTTVLFHYFIELIVQAISSKSHYQNHDWQS